MAVPSEGEVTGGTVQPCQPTERTPLLSSRARRAGGRRPGSTWSNVRARAASERDGGKRDFLSATTPALVACAAANRKKMMAVDV